MHALLIAALVAGVGSSRQHPRPPADETTHAPEQVEQAETLSPAELRARIDGYLGTIDTAIPAARWRALGPQAAGPLAEIAQSSALPTRRAQAIDGLAALGNKAAPSAAALLVKLAQSEEEAQIVRLAAVRGAGRLLPASKLGPTLRPLLEKSRDLHVRAEAAQVLSRHGHCGAVRAQAARETDEEREAFGRALEKCQ